MTGLLGGRSQAQQSPAYTGIDLQTSAYGVTIPVLIGKDRIPAQLIDYLDFKSRKGEAPGGKGGAVGGGKGAEGLREYSASIMMSLGYGPVAAIGIIWNGKSQYNLTNLGMTLFSGSDSQTPWSHLTTNYPDRALPYPGTAYVAVANLDLGSSPTLGNYNFEAQSPYTGEVHGTPGNPAFETEDVSIAHMCALLLTQENFGLGFEDLWSVDDWNAYCCALGLVGSLYLREQQPLKDTLDRLAKSANAEWIWSRGKLRIVVMGDQNVSGNGYSWTAPTAPLFDLTYDDIIVSEGSEPVTQERRRSSDVKNVAKIEWKERANEYNTQTTEAMDDASIAQIGRRPAAVVTAHHWKQAAPALLSAQFELQRQAQRNSYSMRLDSRYCVLEPLDLVRFLDPLIDPSPIPARLQRVTIGADGSVKIETKEYMSGLGNAALRDLDDADRYGVDYNAAAPDVADPILFEPPAVLTNGARQLWIAVNGPGNNWGGCDIYVSDDNTAYRFFATVAGGSRYGELLDALPSHASPDSTNTPRVDLTVSEGILYSTTTAGADALNTTAWVEGELIAYRDADLTAPYTYELGYLVRGARGTPIASHAIGDRWVRIDGNIYPFEFDATRVGKTIYLKFCSFNPFKGGRQKLSDVSAYSITLTGASFGLDEAAAAEIAVLTARVDASPLTIGDVTPASAVTVSGTSWQTLRTIAMTGMAAGGVDWTGTNIRGSGIDGMSGGVSMVCNYRITEQLTSGGTVNTLIAGTLQIDAVSGDISTVTVTDANARVSELGLTGDVTYRLQIQRVSGATSQTGVKGNLKGIYTP